jgi:hypothetical protein
MSGSKYSSWSSPAMWLWSLAFVLPPALAAIAAPKPSDSVPTQTASVQESVRTVPMATIVEAVNPPRRTARRVLIDAPGPYPLTTLAADFWSLGYAPGGDLPTDEWTLDTVPAADAQAAPATEATPAFVTAAEPPAHEPTQVDKPAQVAVAPSSSPTELSPELLELQDKVRQVLSMYYPRHQNTRDNDPWEVMHAIIAYGVDTQLFQGRPGGEKVNAIGWMCYNNPCEGQRMLFLNGGKPDVGRGVGLQGHGGQFMAILAQSHVMSDYPLRIEGKQFTLADLIEREKQTCVSGEELTFKLIALMHYLDSDETWTTPDGQKWSIPRLIREEIKAPIRGVTCGGTHRLMGFSYAVNKRLKRGQPVDGEFRRAEIYTKDYHRYTFGLQNDDGSFSTAWFERRGSDPSIDRRLKTSGHILEWMTFSLSDEDLRDPRMIKATDYVATLMLKNNRHTWEIGPLGHALHAMALYNNRVFEEPVSLQRPPLATDQNAAALEARKGLNWND